MAEATKGGGVEVPKYTLYEAAPAAACQLRVAAVETPVEPWEGESNVTADGRALNTAVLGGPAPASTVPPFPPPLRVSAPPRLRVEWTVAP